MGTLRIEALEHGADAMWLALGPFFCDRATLKDLAGPIYSAPGVTWFVARDATGRVVGFVSAREHGGAVWFDYAYVAPERRSGGVFAELSKARDKWLRARKNKLPLRATMPDRRLPHYTQRGWTEVSRRGSWVTVERAPT